MAEDTKPCPVCGEEIKSVAGKCIHCGELFEKDIGWTGFKGKTLWDWMSLLIVPGVLLVVGVTFSLIQSSMQNDIEAARTAAQAEVEKDRAQEAALQNYLNEMTGLLFEENLRISEEAQDIGWARTLTVLRGLDANRRGMLIQFLQEWELIKVDSPVIKLVGADLSWANLYGVDLRRADLSWTNLYGADLCGADLREANLEGANLEQARYDDNTKWSDDIDPQARGAVKVG